MQTNQYNFIFAFFIFAFFSCNSEIESDQNHDSKCGYGGETIMVIEAEQATIKKGEYKCLLQFEKGIVTGDTYLDDTIYLLLPCNLDEDFQIDGLGIIVSGEIKDNPAFSSHTNYTDFYITEITKAST